ncbi:hypothetical protein [Streptomyces sp. 8K308]|uniref:hypothetical protein n=1 Tax=Streptomyces sp. 8K308 TaxID=2530388 RepID=UPI001405454F|nr:hypothetical protein [Streptomyces sp. 8K308]
MFGLVSLSPAAALGGVSALLVTVAVETVLGVLLWVRVSRVRLVVTERQIEHVGVLRRRVRPRSDATHVVRATLVPPRGLPFPAVFVLDAGGAVIVRLNDGTYTRRDMDRLTDHLGLSWVGPDGPVSARRLAETHPGIVPFFEARPMVTGFMTAAALVLVLMAASMISLLL